MKEIQGNLWEIPATYRVITTNGTVRLDGACVMGRGVALDAKNRYPALPYSLGHRIIEYGNYPFIIHDCHILSLPVKHHWREPADLELIERSLLWISRMQFKETDTLVLPKPGCGNGRLKWEQVAPLCHKYLDDHFTLVHLED